MKNIHVIQTDKPSRLHYWDGILKINNSDIPLGLLYQNIYITSDEEIKVGDWYFNNTGSAIEKLQNRLPSGGVFCKKIILTTDQDLIKDGVQAIDDEFLEWFVKNPSYEEVEVELVALNEYGSEISVNSYGFEKFGYKIIIPKEEQKKPFYCSDRLELDENERCITQCDHCRLLSTETNKQIKLEDIFNDEKRQGVKELIDKHKQEAALKEALLELRKTPMTFEPEQESFVEKMIPLQLKYNLAMLDVMKQESLEEASWKHNPLKKLDGEFLRHAFKEGAKWQAERMYSEEDMAESFMACWKANVPEGFECKLSFNEWLNNLKRNKMKQPCNAHAHQQEEDEIIEGILHLPNVTRLEVIDHTGRAYVIRNAHVELSYQDDGKTLKIFANPKQ